MNKLRLWMIVAVLAVVAAGCTSTLAFQIPGAPTYASTIDNWQQMPIYEHPDSVPGEYEELAHLEGSGDMLNTKTGIIDDMRRTAAKLGANAIIMLGYDRHGYWSEELKAEARATAIRVLDTHDMDAATGDEEERYRAVVVPEGLTWEEARQRAVADGGHLVSITSSEENALVHGLIAETPDIWVNVDVTVVIDGEENPIQVSIGPWIGLYQPPGSFEPAGGWTWVTGESMDYSNWSKQPYVDELEPNDMGGVEHFGQFFGIGLDNRANGWNDQPNNPSVDFTEAGVEFVGDIQSPRGYVVEFE